MVCIISQPDLGGGASLSNVEHLNPSVLNMAIEQYLRLLHLYRFRL